MRLFPLLIFPIIMAACAQEVPPHPRAIQLPDAPFTVGPPAEYQAPRVYDHFRDSHGIFLSSNGTMLVALSAACPHDDCGIVYESMANQFKCSCCARRFTVMGLARGTPPGTPLTMHRLHLLLRGSREDPSPVSSPRLRVLGALCSAFEAQGQGGPRGEEVCGDVVAG